MRKTLLSIFKPFSLDGQVKVTLEVEHLNKIVSITTVISLKGLIDKEGTIGTEASESFTRLEKYIKDNINGNQT